MLLRPILRYLPPRTLHSMSAAPILTLTDTEQAFVHHLDRYASSLTPPVECRIAGGWVRDKVNEFSLAWDW